MLEFDLGSECSPAGRATLAGATRVLLESGLAPPGPALEAAAGQDFWGQLGQPRGTTGPATPEDSLQVRIGELERELVQFRHEFARMQERLALAELAANTDDLTGIANRRRFEDVLDAAVIVARRFREPLSVLMVDVDHFKQFNDDFGHAVGDHVLRFVAGSLLEPWNEDTFAARHGGEEFAVLALRTPLRDAIERAGRIRQRVGRHRMIMRGTRQPLRAVTISVGVAELGRDDLGADLLRRADAALYAAKRAGRDQVHGLVR